MRLLLFGGTRFVGRYLTEAALAAGHQVTLFNRGNTNPDLFPEAETGRFAYWVERVARGGEVLAPGRPDRPVELIDARDLAAWVLRMTERRATGIFNATGPRNVLSLREMLETCRAATGGGATFTWIRDGFLAERGIKLPFWYPEEKDGYNLTDHSRAVSEGLTYRPLEETARDVHAWIAEDPGRQPDKLSPEREAELLREWRERG